MQHRKCCYCEDNIPLKGGGKEVEHFRPQACFESLRNCWKNLLLACPHCNRAKSKKFPVSVSGEPLLLDPSDPCVYPEQHIEFIVKRNQVRLGGKLGLAIARSGSANGQETIQTIDLYSEHHIEKRMPTFKYIRRCYIDLLEELKRVDRGNGDPEKIDELKDELQKACDDNEPYAGLARTFRRVHNLGRLGIV